MGARALQDDAGRTRLGGGETLDGGAGVEGQGRRRASHGITPNVARAMLLVCAALWGGSYLVSKVVMSAVPPQWLMAMRTCGACLVMLALFHKRIIPELNRHIIVPALVVGLTYYGTMVCQTIGLKTIDPGRSAFLTASYCVLTPFVAWIVLRKRPGLLNVVAALLCLLGVGFVSLKPGGFSFALTSGDLLTLVCAVVFSFNLTYLGIYSRRFDPIAVTFVQFAVACVLFAVGAIVTEPAPSASWLQPKVIGGFLYLFLGATTLAQIMQNIGLTHVSATSASILMCTESLFAELFAIVFWGEHLVVSTVIGFALIFVAVLLSILRRDMLIALIHRADKHIQRF